MKPFWEMVFGDFTEGIHLHVGVSTVQKIPFVLVLGKRFSLFFVVAFVSLLVCMLKVEGPVDQGG